MTPDLTDPRTPDMGAERAVLAACMTSPEVTLRIFERLADPTDFVDPRHQVMFWALADLAVTGRPTDPISLRDHLDTRGNLRDAGGPLYLLDVNESLVAVAQAEHHADIVAARAERRRALIGVEQAAQSLHNPAVDTATVLERLTSELNSARRPDGAGGATSGKSWRPVDLGPVLRGEYKRPVPTVGVTRSDGLQFLYPGKEHSVIGEMESGKSWFGSASCAAELIEGNHVVYVHFEETDPTDTVERLLLLGVSASVIEHLFRFVGPEEPVRPDLLAALLDPVPTLVVLDGVNEAMSLHGHAIREEDGAAAFRRHLIKPCTAVGAAVLSADHVVKDREKQGRGPLGSVHKGNAVNGSLILIENAEPFGRGQRGRSHVYVTKDRPGHLRGHGRATKTPGKTFMGELVVDDTRTEWSGLDLRIWAPTDRADDTAATDPHAEVDEHVLDVVRVITNAGESATGRAVRAKSSYGTDKTADALERLVLDGRVAKTPGPRGSHIFTPATGPDSFPREVDPS